MYTSRLCGCFYSYLNLNSVFWPLDSCSSLPSQGQYYSQVFKDRQQQIEEKLEEVQREREESLRQREQLIEEMEIANQMTQRDLERAEEQKEALKLDLKGQVSCV